MHFSCMTICVWVVFKSKVEKNLKMIAVLKSVEGQASCTDERYLFFLKNLPVLPFRVEWKNERYLNFVLTMRM